MPSSCQNHLRADVIAGEERRIPGRRIRRRSRPIARAGRGASRCAAAATSARIASSASREAIGAIARTSMPSGTVDVRRQRAVSNSVRPKRDARARARERAQRERVVRGVDAAERDAGEVEHARAGLRDDAGPRAGGSAGRGGFRSAARSPVQRAATRGTRARIPDANSGREVQRRAIDGRLVLDPTARVGERETERTGTAGPPRRPASAAPRSAGASSRRQPRMRRREDPVPEEVPVRERGTRPSARATAGANSRCRWYPSSTTRSSSARAPTARPRWRRRVPRPRHGVHGAAPARRRPARAATSATQYLSPGP